jgi:GTP 3',8-cyclase
VTRSLIDTFERSVEYLRVSITDLCNFRCIYCRPPEGVKLIAHDEILRYEEILTIVRVAAEHGIRKIRVTGGEPLVRRGVIEFIAALTALNGIEDVGLTTNGVLLASLASDLKAAGITRVNVSLDSLRPEVFRTITRGGRLDDVLAGIRAALAAGLSPVKINVVLLQGINEPDVPEFARLTIDRPLDVRFIERMPFGGDGERSLPESFSAATVLHMIRSEVGPLTPVDRSPLDGPASMYTLPGAQGRIGVIDAVTGHFCGTCNRMRLTARGTLRPCLLSPHEINLRDPLRRGASDEELARILLSAVHAKPMGNTLCATTMGETMNMIGG